MEDSMGWDIPKRSLGDLLKVTLQRKPGRATFSKEGKELESFLAPLQGFHVKVHPSNVLGRPLSQQWQCHIEPTVTGFSIRYRIGKRERESALVIAPQNKELRRQIEGIILAWWQSLLPSDLIAPER